jgi:hypothetical protein
MPQLNVTEDQVKQDIFDALAARALKPLADDDMTIARFIAAHPWLSDTIARGLLKDGVAEGSLIEEKRIDKDGHTPLVYLKVVQ